MRTRSRGFAITLVRSLLLLAALAGRDVCAAADSPAPLVRKVGVTTLNVTVAGLASTDVPRVAGEPEVIADPPEVIVVGGGLSGLTAGWYLRHRKVLILERKDTAGGLAFRGMTPDGIFYARGSAYFAKPVEQAGTIYKELGFDALEKVAIPEPIDSYFYGRKLVRHMWEEEGLKQLPAGFRAFKSALLAAEEAGAVPNQPFEEADNLAMDKLMASEFIKPFGRDLKDFLDSYSQSALGAKTDEVNAAAFLNFYLSEVETRYAWPGGTAGASVHLIAKLNAHNRAMLQTGATVTRVRNVPGGVEVTWIADGRARRATAKHVIMATPLRVTAWLMDDYPAERRALVGRLPYANYVVSNVQTSRDLFTASYDTWFANQSFTDLITARWTETRGFAEKPAGRGVLSIYQPLAPGRKVDIRNEAAVADLITGAVRELGAFIPELKKEKQLDIEAYRWPASIHIAPRNYFKEWVPKLRDPVGRVYFAGNNLGTPSFEEALYRGWRAAKEVEKALVPTGVPVPAR